jgi:hypothetical protein
VVFNQSIFPRRRTDPAHPVVVDEKTVIPKDALVEAISLTRNRGHLRGVARLKLTLDSVEVNGETYEIATKDFGWTGKNHNKRNGILIGGGVGLGVMLAP